MIPLCFPNSISLTSQDGTRLELLGYNPEVGTVLDPARVYLFLKETHQAVHNACQSSGMEMPVPLAPEIIHAIPDAPVELPAYWQLPATRQKRLRVCLLNGGGGGLGDGVMFGPALEILAARLKKHAEVDCLDLDIYSGMPDRTGAILNGIPGVRVLSLPLTLHEFAGYDLYVDFSGMLLDKSFQTTHMTDFALAKMGIGPATVEDSLKNPCFRQLNPPPATVKMALAQARHAAGSRPLTAVIFIATKTRSMPDDLAAQIAREMMPDCQPVIVMPSGLDSKAFLRKHNLQKTALDMSPVSNGFAHYIGILAGMDAIISVDTSAVHIGAALRKPTIGIFSSIDHRLRVRYSSTVYPIQLCYSGRECHAPCGLSKNRYYFQTMLTNGRQIYWDFGYSCDEAFDRQEMTAWLDGKLQRLDLQGDTERQLQDIRRAASECFTKEPAPCWKTLNVPEIIKMLNGMIVQNDGE